MDWESIWGGLSEAASETWDIVQNVTGEVIAKSVQTVKETNKDVETLRANEPVKGQNPDGSPIVVTGQGGTQSMQRQYIQGVDNTIVIIGGALLLAGFGFLLAGRK